MNEARPNGLHFSCFFTRVACLWEQFQLPPPAANHVEKKETIQSLDFFIFLFRHGMSSGQILLLGVQAFIQNIRQWMSRLY